MAVDILGGIEDMVDKGGTQFVEQVRMTAVGNAPFETGMLAGSISFTKVALGEYVISTHAKGYNGTEYPLRIEFGEPVVPTVKKALKFWAPGGGYAGRPIITKYAAPSTKSHFARNTIIAYGGKYTGK